MKITSHTPRLLRHVGVVVMLESSHIAAYAPALRFSRLAMKQNPECIGSDL